jgi:phosphatidate cytidylyltransferase
VTLPYKDANSRWRDLRRRAVAALVLAPLALAAVWLGGLVFGVMSAALGFGLSYEWTRLSRARPILLVAGLAWTWLTFVAIIALRADPVAGRANMMFVLLVVWASDVGAYLAGRKIGGPRLAPRISPGKTWAGAAGGLIAAVAVGLIVARLASGPTALGLAALVAAVLSIIGQAGDLAESALKRHFGVKDSGRLIPGHGGLLDRLDAALTAVPAAALLANLIGPGVVLWQ